MSMTGDFISFGECRLQNLRVQEIRKNGERVGEKCLVDVVTWGDTFTAEVDQKYAESLPFKKTGRAFLSSEIVTKTDIKNFDGRAYGKDVTVCTDLKLVSFEVSK